MPIIIPPFEPLLEAAVAHYWRTLTEQGQRQGGTDQGNRSAVTGGRQMDGFVQLVTAVLKANGVDEVGIYGRRDRELPGYFRATKDWDLVVMYQDFLVAAIEFKSQRGPSFGNNFNNRTEEALGSAVDLQTAFREGTFGIRAPRPWVGWLMLLEASDRSLQPVRPKSKHFPVRPEFEGASYARRYELLLRKLVGEHLYDSAALLLSPDPSRAPERSYEPAEDLSMRRFLASLAGHAAGFAAGL